MDFEVVKFVATTRRWYDKGNLRDAGEATPAKVRCSMRVTEIFRGSF